MAFLICNLRPTGYVRSWLCKFQILTPIHTSLFKTMLLGIIVTELCCSHGAYMSFCVVILVPKSLNKVNSEVKKFCKGLVLKVIKWMPGI